MSLEESGLWAETCEDAACEIRRHLRSGVDENKHHRRLEAAAAVLAFYRHVIYRASGGGMHEFTAGEIKVRADAKVSANLALMVWKDAKHSIADLIDDDEFMFETIL